MKFISVSKSVIFLAVFLFPFSSHTQNIRNWIDQKESGRYDTIIHFQDREQESVLPFTVLKGKKTGPVFTIVAGIHGYEYPPIMAVQKLMGEVEVEKLSGTLVILPIASVEAFYKRTVFIHPFDGKNLNTVFPGAENGTMSERIAYFISREVIPVSDVFLDIHGGDASEELLPFVCYYNRLDAPEQTALAKKLCEVSGFHTVVSYPYKLAENEAAKYAFKQAVQHGITALSIEAGELGNVQIENVKSIQSAVYSMLSELNIYVEFQDLNPLSFRLLNRQEYIRVTEKGIFYSDYHAGDSVKKGAILGIITDEFGKKLQEISSPREGVILYKVGTPPVNPGETLFCIGFSE